jgi:hypothetical protein
MAALQCQLLTDQRQQRRISEVEEHRAADHLVGDCEQRRESAVGTFCMDRLRFARELVRG